MKRKIITICYLTYRYFLRLYAGLNFKLKFINILESFEKFSTLGQISSSSKNSRQPIKGYDLFILLDKYIPKKICELGSGTTSAIFSSWSNKNNSEFVAYASFEKWTKVTIECIKHLSKNSDLEILYVPSEISPDQSATRFSKPIPVGSDFVYIDGPPCILETGKKVPNDDIILFFESGNKPKTIVIDGRLETVDLILNHEYSSHYKFHPSYQYARMNNRLLDSLSFREHTIFELK